MSYVKTYARILGWTFVTVGVVGFFLTGFGGFFGMDGETHLAVGALGIGVVAASARRGTQPAEA